jgi:hypothetical protein
VWKWTIYGSVATIKVPASVVNLVANGAPFYLVWTPADLVRHDSTGTGYGNYSGVGNATPPSWSHTITGNAVVVFANVLVNSATPATVTATCGGVAMTSLATITNYYAFSPIWVSMYAFGLLNPPTGTSTISMSVSASHFATGNSVSYSGVDSFGPAVTTNNAGTTKMQVLSRQNRLVTQAFSLYNQFAIDNYNQNLRSVIPFSNIGNVGIVVGDAPSQAIDYQPGLEFSVNNSNGSPWAGIAVPLVPQATSIAAGYSINSGLVAKS